MRLYELTNEYRRVAELIEQDAAPEDVETALTVITGEMKAKATNIAMLIEDLDASAEAIRTAEKRMAERRKAVENQADRIRQYLLTSMLGSGITMIECPHFKITVRDTPPAVVVDDETAIPTEYMRQPPAVPDKKKIMDDLKVGVVIDGVHAEKGKTLQIR